MIRHVTIDTSFCIVKDVESGLWKVYYDFKHELDYNSSLLTNAIRLGIEEEVSEILANFWLLEKFEKEFNRFVLIKAIPYDIPGIDEEKSKELCFLMSKCELDNLKLFKIEL